MRNKTSWKWLEKHGEHVADMKDIKLRDSEKCMVVKVQ